MENEGRFSVGDNPYEVCALCGSTHVNDKFCPALTKKKIKRGAWICEILRRKLGRMMGMF